jgi:hypothetical protein
MKLLRGWRVSMGRRQVVESANSALKGGFADLSHGFFWLCRRSLRLRA